MLLCILKGSCPGVHPKPSKTKILSTLRERSSVMDIIKKLVLKHVKSDGLDAFMREKSFQASESYNPSKPLLYGESLDKKLNTYILPSYQRTRSDSKTRDLSHYHSFMKNLFPCGKSLEAVECWMWQSLNRKALTHLLLVGVKGCGKSFFANNILSALHGFENHYIESALQARSSFDPPEDMKTLIFTDEACFSNQEAKAKIKHKLNKYGSFSKKYISNTTKARSFSSHVYAANYADTLCVELDDRCFTIPNLTTEPAYESSEKMQSIDFLSRVFEQDHRDHNAYLKSIYDHLESKYAERVDESLLIFTDNFRDLVLASDTDPRKSFFDHCRLYESFSTNEINQKFKSKSGKQTHFVEYKYFLEVKRKFKARFGIDIAEYNKDTGVFTSLIFEGLEVAL